MAPTRPIRYLRLSITDRCNLRCLYCRGEDTPRIPHEKVLRYEEFLRLARVFHSLGVNKIRVTGGEPFARKDCVAFLAALKRALPGINLCVTTNGTLLEPHIAELGRLGLASINISLDSFDSATYQGLCGKPLLPVVLNNIQKLLSIGCRVKINAVAMRGITDAQMGEFMRAASSMPLDVRFIEFMPMGSSTLWSHDKFISCAELLERAREHVRLEALPRGQDKLAGPAVMYAIPGARGKVGFISAISSHFCSTCSRVRLTSEGKLRLCLFEDREYRLAPILRSGQIGDACLERAIRNALPRKPLGCDILAARTGSAVAAKHMVGIGG